MALTAASNFAGPTAASAQDRSPRQDRIREDIVLRESIDVRLISLDAVVTDSSDRPVTGLTKGVGYAFMVRAVNAQGYAPDSNEAAATLDGADLTVSASVVKI